MKTVVGAALAFALAIPSFSSAQSPIDKLSAEFEAAFIARDAIKLASMYAEDAVLMPPNEPIVKGRTNIEAYFKKVFAAGIGTLKVTVLESSVSGSMGFSAGTYTLTTGQSAQLLLGVGGPRVQAGKYVMVFESTKGDWKIIYDIHNSDQPPPK